MMAKYANTYDSTYAPNPVTAKKKKPIPQAGSQGGAMPITGGPTQVVKGPAQGAPGGGAAGTLAPRPTGGTSVWDGGGVASPNPGGKDIYNWDESIRTPVGSGPRPPAGGGSAPPPGGGAQDNWAEDDLLGTSGTDYEDTRNLLYERIQQLMSEGATSTAELEEIIASQYGDVLDQGMGGILAQAGAGGMGLGGGMVGQSQDLARQVATDQSAAVIDARRQAEADLMDRLGVAGDLFGLGLEDMDREDFWAFMENMNAPPGDEDTTPPSLNSDLDTTGGDVAAYLLGSEEMDSVPEDADVTPIPGTGGVYYTWVGENGQKYHTYVPYDHLTEGDDGLTDAQREAEKDQFNDNMDTQIGTGGLIRLAGRTAGLDIPKIKWF